MALYSQCLIFSPLFFFLPSFIKQKIKIISKNKTISPTSIHFSLASNKIHNIFFFSRISYTIIHLINNTIPKSLSHHNPLPLFVSVCLCIHLNGFHHNQKPKTKTSLSSFISSSSIYKYLCGFYHNQKQVFFYLYISMWFLPQPKTKSKQKQAYLSSFISSSSIYTYLCGFHHNPPKPNKENQTSCCCYCCYFKYVL